MLADDDEVTSRLSVEQIREIRDQVWQASQANARQAVDTLSRISGLRHPRDLSELTDEEILSCFTSPATG
ncbi:MAG TPA: hypothetical protein VFO16_24345 [Pseudonocardiaceae bacterium]|nr:hypothetical protein [Pseudonocardiaceae bacterium]